MGQALASNIQELVVTLQLLVQLTPAQLWADLMHNSGLFAYIVKVVMEDEERTSLLTEYVCLLARMAISDPVVLNQLVSATATATQRPESEIWMGIMDQIWRRVCAYNSIENRGVDSEPLCSSTICLNLATEN